MPNQGQTALLVPVPVADPLLAAAARSNPAAVRAGVPAHVSLAYPFVTLEEVPEARSWLRDFAELQPHVTLDLTEARQGPGWVYLPAAQMAPLVAATRARWPRLVPYDGRFGENPEPHVTLAMGVTQEQGAEIAARCQAALPLTAVADQIWLVRYDNGWIPVDTLRLTCSGS